ncbi:TPA: hypothetical protein ACGTAQ_005036, partial [Escherichia coli]
MGKNQEERKTPVIVVKKRRTFSLPSLSEKTDIIAPVFTEQTAESAPAGINSSAVVNAKIIGRFGDADDFLDCFIIPARIV